MNPIRSIVNVSATIRPISESLDVLHKVDVSQARYTLLYFYKFAGVRHISTNLPTVATVQLQNALYMELTKRVMQFKLIR